MMVILKIMITLVLSTLQNVVEVPKPIEGEEIPALKEKLDSLKDANFTVVTQEISEDWYGNINNTYYKAFSDGVNSSIKLYW